MVTVALRQVSQHPGLTVCGEVLATIHEVVERYALPGALVEAGTDVK